MRIVLSSPRAGWGGTATICMSLAGGLEERGHEVVVFCKPSSELHRAVHGRFECEPILHGIDFPPPAIARCRAAFRRHGTQAVLSLLHMDLRLTAAAARLSGLRVLAHRAEMEPFSSLPHRRFLVDRLPHHWVANSEANRRTMLSSGSWLTDDHVTTICNGIDPTPFETAKPAELGLPAGGITIGFIGRLVIEKGLPELAAAWRRLAESNLELNLVIAGEGNYAPTLKESLEGTRGVRWLGYQPDVGAVLKAVDIVVIPSWNEPFGIVALEAMAASRPVIATRAGGLKEVVHDGGTGVLVRPRDERALAEAILRLAKDGDLRNAMGNAGLQRVRHSFSEAAMVAAYEEVLERQIELGEGAPS